MGSLGRGLLYNLEWLDTLVDEGCECVVDGGGTDAAAKCLGCRAAELLSRVDEEIDNFFAVNVGTGRTEEVANDSNEGAK